MKARRKQRKQRKNERKKENLSFCLVLTGLFSDDSNLSPEHKFRGQNLSECVARRLAARDDDHACVVRVVAAV